MSFRSPCSSQEAHALLLAASLPFPFCPILPSFPLAPLKRGRLTRRLQRPVVLSSCVPEKYALPNKKAISTPYLKQNIEINKSGGKRAKNFKTSITISLIKKLRKYFFPKLRPGYILFTYFEINS